MASIARVAAATVTFVASVACASPGTQAAPLGSVGPVVGTSEITYSLSSFAPTRVTEAIGQYRVTSRWAISDASHWRLDSHTLQPALQRHAETVVANGSSLTWYTSLYHTAWSIPQPSGATLGVLGMWEAGALASAVQGLVPPYFAHLESLGLHVRRLGSEVILGQVADAFEVSPLYRDAGRPYGRATLWLDSDYPLVLRLEMHGLRHSLGDPVHWVYRVTSITFGQGPSTEDLAYHPPVPATSPPTTFSGEGSSQGGRGVRWLVPAGFIPVGTPSAYILSGTESEQDPAAGGTSEIAALFWHASTFLYVEEQLRFPALPASLERGARVRAGACWIRSGHLRHSNLYWLALRRSHVALEVLSNHLNQAQLTAYAGSEICR